jgi:hypothetical protein
MKVGFAQNIITPKPLEWPVYLAGFGNNRQAEDVHDDLYARALAISDDQKTLVLCSLDLVGFFRKDVLKAVAGVKDSPEGRSIPNLQIVISSTHTHHGPDTMGLWGPNGRTSGVNQAYHEILLDKIIVAIKMALRKMIDVSAVKMASMHFPGLAKNARNPEVVDDELVMAQFIGPDTISPLLTVMNFPCHPEVLWEHNTHITADYPGYLRKEAERLTGAPCIFFSADLGGMMTPDVKDHSFEEAEFMGKALAKAGVDALAQASILKEFNISLQKKDIQVKLANILFKFAIRRGLFPDIRDEKGLIHSEVNLLKIGPLWFATIPGELLPKLGMALKAELRAAGAGSAGVIGLANDELGYILPKDEFRYPLNPFKPGKHYEETMSVSKEIGPVIVNALQELTHG